MSLIFKKKDKMKTENYRPITLLETDYKIHTKTVANKLGKVCQNLIHKDQAGFIPGRSLFDHTNLAHLVVDYAERYLQVNLSASMRVAGLAATAAALVTVKVMVSVTASVMSQHDEHESERHRYFVIIYVQT